MSGKPLTFDAIATMVGKLFLEKTHELECLRDEADRAIAEVRGRAEIAEQERDKLLGLLAKKEDVVL